MPDEGDYPPLSPEELVKICEKHFRFISLPGQLPPLDAVLLGISETKKKKKAGDLFFKPSRRGPSEKAMAPHSSALAWKIPWTEEPGRLQSMGWLRVGHD